MGRGAIPSYMDVLDFPQVLLEAMRNACIFSTYNSKTELLPADSSETNYNILRNQFFDYKPHVEISLRQITKKRVCICRGGEIKMLMKPHSCLVMCFPCVRLLIKF